MLLVADVEFLGGLELLTDDLRPAELVFDWGREILAEEPNA
jgi:hypothetical protein